MTQILFKTGINIATSFCAFCATAFGCAAYWAKDRYIHFDDGVYIAIYMIEGLFLLSKSPLLLRYIQNFVLVVFIASCTAPGRVGCWWSMENAVQPEAQPDHMIYNPHFGQQMQYQNNAYNPYNPHQPQIPVQHMSAQQMPITTTVPTMTATPVTASPANPISNADEPKLTETEQKAFSPENERNYETIAIESEADGENNFSGTTMEANSNV